MNIITLIGLLIMTLAGTFGAIFFKRASSAIEKQNLWNVLKNINLYIGGGFYILGAGLNVLLLRHLDYSLVYPMTSLTYVWTMIMSYLIFGEKINKYKIVAVILILLGAVTINL